MKRQILTFALAATTLSTYAEQGNACDIPYKIVCLEIDQALIDAMDTLKKNNATFPIFRNAMNIVRNRVVPYYNQQEQQIAYQHLLSRKEMERTYSLPENFETALRTEVKVVKNFLSNRKTLEETEVQRTYDNSLLGLLDCLHQNGDPDYLKNAHDFAEKFIIPTHSQNTQEVLLKHAAARREQAQANGQYQEMFVSWLRYEVNRAQKITTQKTPVPTNKQHQK